mgnify:CR=1 FL=1
MSKEFIETTLTKYVDDLEVKAEEHDAIIKGLEK